MQPAFVWKGKSSLRPDIFEQLESSHSVAAAGRGALPRASRDDYADRLTSRGLLQRPEELSSRPTLVAEVQAHWHSVAATTCLFDAYLSANREEHGWITIIPEAREEASATAEAIAGHVRKSLPEPGVEIVSVLLPSVCAIDDLAAILVALSSQDNWYVVSAGRDDDAQCGRVALVGLRTRVGGGQTSVVLGFGPFPTCAPTRQAPFVELILRAKPGVHERPSRRALFEDLELPELPAALKEGWARRTAGLRGLLVPQSHGCRATSRVSFTVPETVWQSATEAVQS